MWESLRATLDKHLAEALVKVVVPLVAIQGGVPAVIRRVAATGLAETHFGSVLTTFAVAFFALPLLVAGLQVGSAARINWWWVALAAMMGLLITGVAAGSQPWGALVAIAYWIGLASWAWTRSEKPLPATALMAVGCVSLAALVGQCVDDRLDCDGAESMKPLCAYVSLRNEVLEGRRRTITEWLALPHLGSASVPSEAARLHAAGEMRRCRGEHANLLEGMLRTRTVDSPGTDRQCAARDSIAMATRRFVEAHAMDSLNVLRVLAQNDLARRLNFIRLVGLVALLTSSCAIAIFLGRSFGAGEPRGARGFLVLMLFLATPVLPAFRPEHLDLDDLASVYAFPQWSVARSMKEPLKPPPPERRVAELSDSTHARIARSLRELLEEAGR